ncbi:MAG: phospholipase D family protein [Bacteroidetes bacterium]|nr:phospholipase D family protein [Bacteroidota bacterium]
MNIKLLGQGFEPTSADSVGNQLIKFFSDTDFHTFTGISAFASQAGVNGLAKHIASAKKHLNIITIVTGVDQKGTSKEALEALLKLNINAYVFYQPSYTIFHPKIYLFEGAEKSELIIGSSNLTAQGLFTNVEASLLISIDNSIESDKEIINQLKDYFKGIFDFSDPNLKKLSKKIIADLVKAKVVPTEAERKAIQDKAPTADKQETGNIISKIFPKRTLAKIPKEFRSDRKPKGKADKEEKIEIKSKASKLLWESGALTERDLTTPKGSTTHQTGSMLFKKGKLKGIDQRHYFRDKVFSSLSWSQDTKPSTSHLEKATALFRIIIMGKDYGVFKLTITHNPKTDTRSYEQKNSMTSISWGKARKIIAQDKLIGKNASLYKNAKKKDEFTLIIE